MMITWTPWTDKICHCNDALWHGLPCPAHGAHNAAKPYREVGNMNELEARLAEARLAQYVLSSSDPYETMGIQNARVAELELQVHNAQNAKPYREGGSMGETPRYTNEDNVLRICGFCGQTYKGHGPCACPEHKQANYQEPAQPKKGVCPSCHELGTHHPDCSRLEMAQAIGMVKSAIGMCVDEAPHEKIRKLLWDVVTRLYEVAEALNARLGQPQEEEAPDPDWEHER